MKPAAPRTGATTFGDLLGQLDWLDILCLKCDRCDRYRIHGLAARYGRDCKVPDWIGHVTGECPRRKPGLADACEARCPDLFKIR